MTGAIGRPGDRTMEINGGYAVSYLTHTPCVPMLLLMLIDLEAHGLLDSQGRRGITSVVRWNPGLVIFGVIIDPEAAKSIK